MSTQTKIEEMNNPSVTFYKDTTPNAQAIYEDANEQCVAVYVLHHKTSESSNPSAYVDADFTTKATKAQLKNFFLKGCVIKSGTKLLVPTEYDTATDKMTAGTLTFVGA